MTLQRVIEYLEQNHACRVSMAFMHRCESLQEAYDNAMFWWLLWLITLLNLQSSEENEAWISFRESWIDFAYGKDISGWGFDFMEYTTDCLKQAYPLDLLLKTLEEKIK
jgi:hypothetical protein